METTVYDSATLLGVYWNTDYRKPPENYWLSNFFKSEVNFTTEEIDFSKISDIRKLAPLVVPTAQGVPIYSAAERLSTVKPAYIKPKDPVSASRMIRRAAGFGELGRSRTAMSPQERYNAIVADIILQHRFAIERRWEWMAAHAIIDAQNILEDERYPRTIVDFQRAANQTITLGAGTRWGDAGVSILDSIAMMRKRVRDAPFGGVTNRLTIGGDVWDVMRQDPEIKELLNTQYRSNADVSLKMGLLEGLEVEYVGQLSGTLEVYVYSDYYQLPNGTAVPYMSPKDVVLTGGNVQGVRAFGAIQDIGAQFQPLSVFPKMWNEQDPSATFVMTQSAPLMVPVNPNNTLKATVVA